MDVVGFRERMEPLSIGRIAGIAIIAKTVAIGWYFFGRSYAIR